MKFIKWDKALKIGAGLITLAGAIVGSINQKNDLKALKTELKDELLKELGK